MWLCNSSRSKSKQGRGTASRLHARPHPHPPSQAAAAASRRMRSVRARGVERVKELEAGQGPRTRPRRARRGEKGRGARRETHTTEAGDGGPRPPQREWREGRGKRPAARKQGCQRGTNAHARVPRPRPLARLGAPRSPCLCKTWVQGEDGKKRTSGGCVVAHSTRTPARTGCEGGLGAWASFPSGRAQA